MKKRSLFSCFILIFCGFILSQTGTISNVKPSGGKLFNLMPSSIAWTATGTANPFRILLFKDGVKVGIIVNSISAGNGPRSIPWQVGKYIGGRAPLGKGYQIKVKEIGHKVFAFSSSSFEIARTPLVKIKLKPRIEQMFDVPLGALKVGTQLYINGSHFGTKKGQILMYGNFPISPVPLADVNWVSSKKVNGVVPKFSTTGVPDQTVEIRIKTAENLFSNTKKIGFEGRKEIKMLVSTDVAVLNCGNDGNVNLCNQPGDHFHHATIGEATIFGFHRNTTGAIGDDVGNDVYQINLNNGWKFKDIKIVGWHGTSKNEVLTGPSPPLPVGGTSWTTTIHWKVTPADWVSYYIRVYVEGLLGTHYR